MEAIIAQAIKDTTALKKTSVSWTPDEPYAQSYYDFDSATSSWVSRAPGNVEATQNSSESIAKIALFTWNIDFMLPFAEARMKPALAHLDRLTRLGALAATTASVIFLQECVPSDLATIAAQPWVRERFHLLDTDATHWATAHYGTTILGDARLPITAAFRVHYSKTRSKKDILPLYIPGQFARTLHGGVLDRDAFFVDVTLGPDNKKIRLCNTHLESMAFDPPFRPPQVELVARYLREAGVHAALAGGDFNAIQPFDRTLHADNNLKDAFLELGGKEDTNEGFTWGQQAATALRAQFGCSRMDKVYFCGDVELVRFERFGQDVLVEGEEEGKAIVELGFEKPWVTDHLGIVAEFEIARREKEQL